MIIACFSGTGGTKRIADAFTKELEHRGTNAIQISLDNLRQPLPEDDSMVLLLYSVHAFDAPEPVYRWIDSLKTQQGRKAAVISVSGGGEMWPNTVSRVECIKALEDKGFHVVYERMMVMPCNIAISSGDQVSMHLLRVVPEKTARIVDELLAGTVRRTKHWKGPLLRAFSRYEKRETKKFAKSYQIGDGCTGCGWCSRSCPVDNIVMKENRPEFQDSCVLCMRCVYGCPNKQLSSKSFAVLKQGFDLKALEERMAGVELEPVEGLAKGFLWMGVRRYFREDADK